MRAFNAKTQRGKDAKDFVNRLSLRLGVFAPLR